MEKYKKLEKGTVINEGDIFYVFDSDIPDLPPLGVKVTAWGAKQALEGDDYIQVENIYSEEIMKKWKTEYGTSKRKWKDFLKDLPKKGWMFLDKMHVKTVFPTKTVIVSFDVTTTSTEEEIFAAVSKGIFYGLDVKNVAAPANITINKVQMRIKTEEL